MMFLVVFTFLFVRSMTFITLLRSVILCWIVWYWYSTYSRRYIFSCKINWRYIRIIFALTSISGCIFYSLSISKFRSLIITMSYWLLRWESLLMIELVDIFNISSLNIRLIKFWSTIILLSLIRIIYNLSKLNSLYLSIG